MKVVSASGRSRATYGNEPGMRWEPGLTFEVAEGEFAVILTAAGPAKDRVLKMLSFADRYEEVDIYFQGRLTGRAGRLEAEAMQAQVKTLDATSAQSAADSDPQWKAPLVLVDLTGTPTSSVSIAAVLRAVRRVCVAGAAAIALTADPSIALQADAVYRLGDSGIHRIVG